MTFEILTPTDATLSSVTPRTEKHGDDDVFAISLGLKVTGPNTLLDLLAPGLRDALYKAAEGQEDLPGVEPATPLLRCKLIETLALGACFEGWTLAVDHGIDEADPIKLGGSKVDKFRVTPREGGSVDIAFRVGSNDIDATEAGLLCSHLGQGISFTLTAPAIKKGEVIDGTVGHPGAAAAVHASLLEDEAGQTPEGALAESVGGDPGESDPDESSDDDGSAHPDAGKGDAAAFEAGAAQAIAKARGKRGGGSRVTAE